jgi:four helix bundle protein
MSSSFRDLRVWQRGMEMVEAVYGVSEAFPRTEIYGLTSQVRRAAISIPSNIAEGHTRASTKEFLHHLAVAQASLAEVDTQLELAARLHYAATEAVQPVHEQCVVLAKQLHQLRGSLLRRTRPAANPQSLIPNP